MKYLFVFSDDLINFVTNGMKSDMFGKDILYFANKNYRSWRKNNFISYLYSDDDYEYEYDSDDDYIDYEYDGDDNNVVGYYIDKYNLYHKYKKKYNMNNFIINSFEVVIYINNYKILHKRDFYNDLYDDIMAAAWHTDRYLDWCLDFEELRDLKKRWSID